MTPPRTSRSIVIALLAGLGLGVTLVFYAQTGSDSGLWPIVSARVAAACVAGIAVAFVARTAPIRPAPMPRRLAIGAGVCDVSATAFMVFGVRHDLTVIVAPLAALGPGFTVMLAWALLREPISRTQVFGLGLALVALALIAAG